MPWLALAPSIVATVLSLGSTVGLIVAIANVVVAFFAINTILNLGTQQETGDTIEAFDTYKSVSVAALTITWIVAIVVIVLALI